MPPKDDKKKERELSATDKAAIVLFSLGEDIASDVLQYLHHDDVRELSKSMTKMESLPGRRVEEVVNEFHDVVSNEEGVIVSIGEDYIKTVISKVLGEKTAERLLESISLQEDSSYLEIFRNLDIKVLAEFVKNEHPQTISLVLSQLLPDEAGYVLSSLPENLQVDVLDRLAKLDTIPPDLMRDVANVLDSEIKTAQTGPKRYGGVKAISEMLNSIDRQLSSSILARVEEQDPDMAEEIRQNMFIFEDLLKIEERGIQEILKEITTDVLAKAMKTASDPIKEKIFKNMSERAADMLREDIEDMGPTRLTDIEKAQNEVVKIALKLADEGKIFISGGSEGDVFV